MSLSFNNYQRDCRDTAIYPMNLSLQYLTLGLVSEAGEVASIQKKFLRTDMKFSETKEKMMDELGDCLWYIAELCSFYDINLEDVAIRNQEKLLKRMEENKIKGDGDYR